MNLLAMVVTAWALTAEAKAAPLYVGESILMLGGSMSAVHWVILYRRRRGPRAGALLRLLCCLEMRSGGWSFSGQAHALDCERFGGRCVSMGSIHDRFQPSRAPSRHRLAGAEPAEDGSGSLYRHLGIQYVDGVGSSTIHRRTYDSGRQS